MSLLESIRAAGGRVALTDKGRPSIAGAPAGLVAQAAKDPDVLIEELRREFESNLRRMLGRVLAREDSSDVRALASLVEGAIDAAQDSARAFADYRSTHMAEVTRLSRRIDLDTPREGLALFNLVLSTFPDCSFAKALQEVFA